MSLHCMTHHSHGKWCNNLATLCLQFYLDKAKTSDNVFAVQSFAASLI